MVRRRFVPYKSLLKAVKRAKKLKDLEIAKSLEVTNMKEVLQKNNRGHNKDSKK